jgi:hypothetical protein
VTLAAGDSFLPGAGFAFADEGFLAYGVLSRNQTLISARSERLSVFDPTETLPWESATGATGAFVGDHPSLYFVAKIGQGPALYVARIDGSKLGDAIPVTIDGTRIVPHWPQAVGLPDGRVLLAFVDPQRRIFVGVDDGTGARFNVSELAVPEKELRGVLAHVGTTKEGSWVLTYQVADPAWNFRSFVVLSHDRGASWTTPVQLDSKGSVSDAFPVARVDGGADVYYVTAASVKVTVLGFTRTDRDVMVRRRALADDGTLGPEQIVTREEVGPVAKPQPRRLHDGRIGMMLLKIAGSRTRDLAFALLDGDAPPVPAPGPK